MRKIKISAIIIIINNFSDIQRKQSNTNCDTDNDNDDGLETNSSDIPQHNYLNSSK